MDQLKLKHPSEVGSFRFLHLLDVVNLDVLQKLDELNLDVGPTFLDEAHQLDQLDQSDVVVDAELRHRLRMDYFLGEVGVELRHLQRMDCCLDVVGLE